MPPARIARRRQTAASRSPYCPWDARAGSNAAGAPEAAARSRQTGRSAGRHRGHLRAPVRACADSGNRRRRLVRRARQRPGAEPGARARSLARSVRGSRLGQLGHADPRDARGGRRRADRGFLRAPGGDRCIGDARFDRARARFRRRLARTANGDPVGARGEAGRRGRRVPDPRAEHRGRPDGRRLGAPDRTRALSLLRGGLGVAVAASTAAAP